MGSLRRFPGRRGTFILDLLDVHRTAHNQPAPGLIWALHCAIDGPETIPPNGHLSFNHGRRFMIGWAAGLLPPSAAILAAQACHQRRPQASTPRPQIQNDRAMTERPSWRNRWVIRNWLKPGNEAGPRQGTPAAEKDAPTSNYRRPTP
jgi:hypothetical protein